MKLHQLCLTFSLVAFSVTAHAELVGCAAKIDRVERELVQAKHYNNTFKIRGLEKALQEIKQNCTDEKLLEKINNNIKDKADKVEERKQELVDAQNKNDAKKVRKAERKLLAAEEELKEAKEDSE